MDPIADALVAMGHIVLTDEGGELTTSGERFLSSFGAGQSIGYLDQPGRHRNWPYCGCLSHFHIGIPHDDAAPLA
jgi:hypothetical protein